MTERHPARPARTMILVELVDVTDESAIRRLARNLRTDGAAHAGAFLQAEHTGYQVCINGYLLPDGTVELLPDVELE